ncbi:MAG: hypothetical protein IJJ72_02165 [Bacteroidales bacterium]|nr:hypothetical protein [Bacteroidales bacterium]
MAFQETTRQSYGSKVKGSFQGILWGIILIIAGTVILWWNEGRAVKASDALKDFQKNYVELSDITTLDPEFEGKAVHATGVAVTADTLRDAAFGIAVNAMKLARNVEYYQWTEDSESESKDKLGGSTETTTTYTYEPAWCSEPVNSNEFRDPDYKGKNFVLRVIEETEQTASNVTFGAYRLTPSIVGAISGEEPAYPALTDTQKKQLLANVADSTVVVSVSGDQVYIGADPSNPHIGDVRITFTQVTSPKTISLLQKVVNGTFENYIAKNGRPFSKVSMGTVSAENMIENQKSANKMMLWIFRILGIILVVAGFRSLLNFLSTVFAVVPFVQRIIGTGIGLVTTIVGLVWSFIVIAIAWVAHRPVLAIILLVAAAALIYWLVSRNRKKKLNNVAAILVLVLALGLSAGCKGTDNNVKNGENPERDLSVVFKGPVQAILLTTEYGEGEPGFTEYKFDEKGKLVSEEEIYPFGEEGDSELLESLSEKDSEGRYTKQVWGSGEDDIYSIDYTEYTPEGRVAKVEYMNGEGEHISTTSYQYDEAGNQTSTFTKNYFNNSTYSDEREYDSQNRILKSVSSYDGKVSSIQTYQYDVDGWDSVCETEWVDLGKKALQYEKMLKDVESTAVRHFETDGNGTRMTFSDTVFIDAKGMRHERNYYNYDNEYSYEGVFNKKGYLTHYELFKGKSTLPCKTLDFEMAPDGESLKSVTYRTQEFGQVNEQKLPQVWETDTYGNWTDRTLGFRYSPDLFYMDNPEQFYQQAATQHRTITYYGVDQGQNYGFEGKNGDSQLRLQWTNDNGVLCGEAILDGDPVRIVGTKERGSLDWHIVALQKDGTIPWHLYFDSEGDKRTATIVKGMDEYKIPMTATRKGLKTYSFKAKSDDIVGLYEYKDKGGDTGDGQLDVSRCGENWEDYHFEISNTGPAPSFNMATDEFTSSPDESLRFYNYLWNDDSETSFSYTIRFFDGFAVIQRESGSPMGFFGMGMTVAGIYAKLPSVG